MPAVRGYAGPSGAPQCCIVTMHHRALLAGQRTSAVIHLVVGNTAGTQADPGTVAVHHCLGQMHDPKKGQGCEQSHVLSAQTIPHLRAFMHRSFGFYWVRGSDAVSIYGCALALQHHVLHLCT